LAAESKTFDSELNPRIQVAIPSKAPLPRVSSLKYSPLEEAAFKLAFNGDEIKVDSLTDSAAIEARVWEMTWIAVDCSSRVSTISLHMFAAQTAFSLGVKSRRWTCRRHDA
jgi:hypothetical protein